MSYETPNLPSTPGPKVSEKICPLATISHRTLELPKLFAPDGVPQYQVAVAVILPRKNIIARLRGSGNLNPVSSFQYENIDTNDLARRRAISETLFEHLAVNCLACPLSDVCKERMPLAQLARDLRLEDSFATPTE